VIHDDMSYDPIQGQRRTKKLSRFFIFILVRRPVTFKVKVLRGVDRQSLMGHVYIKYCNVAVKILLCGLCSRVATLSSGPKLNGATSPCDRAQEQEQACESHSGTSSAADTSSSRLTLKRKHWCEKRIEEYVSLVSSDCIIVTSCCCLDSRVYAYCPQLELLDICWKLTV